MRIAELRNRHAGKDIYLVGTGPSMRVFTAEVLRDKVTIGLNQAWRYAPMTYSLTAHPELVLEYLATPAASRNATCWVVKKKPPMADLTLDDPKHYVFRTSAEVEVVCTRPADTLYLGHGIQCTALDLAAQMGAKVIYLVGVDMASIGGDHHGHQQHVRFHGLPPTDVYAEYRRFTARVRKSIYDKFKIPVLTLSPFLGQDAATEDYLRLLDERGLSKLPPPVDTSGYARKSTDP